MAIDTKKKRGSLINLSSPARPWTTEPDGLLDSSARLSIRGYAARDVASGDLINSLFARYSQAQDDAILRKWGQTAVSGMSDNELKWCMANEVSASSTEAEVKWAHKIV